MSELFHEFVIWSIGFAVVSSVAMLIGHLVGRRIRKANAAVDAAGSEPPAKATRRPAWGATLIIFAAYLLLLGPVLQGVGSAFRHQQPAANPSVEPESLSALAAGQRLDDLKSSAGSDAANCPCKTERRSGTLPIPETSKDSSASSTTATFDVEAASSGRTPNDLPE